MSAVSPSKQLRRNDHSDCPALELILDSVIDARRCLSCAGCVEPAQRANQSALPAKLAWPVFVPASTMTCTQRVSPTHLDRRPPPEFAVLPPPTLSHRLPQDWTNFCIGEYRILKLLGQGGMGMVFMACHVRLGHFVALKMLRSVDTKSTLHKRFINEARAIAQLDHANIVRLHEIGQVILPGDSNEQPYFTLELCPGGTLADLLCRRASSLSVQQVVALIEPVCRAIGFAHSKQILHRDLKPGNILLTANGQPKVADFGLAKWLDTDLTKLTSADLVVGTPVYMSPEQTRGQDLTPQSDIYSLGTILYECVTGQPPFQSYNIPLLLAQIQVVDPIPPARLVPNLPADMNTIILKCLEKQPARRYASAEALADDLRALVENRPIKARPVGRIERLVKFIHRKPLQTALIAVCLTAVTALFGLSLAYSYHVGQARGEIELSEERHRTALARERELRHIADLQLLGGVIGEAKERMVRRDSGWSRDVLALVRQAAQNPFAEHRAVELRSMLAECFSNVDVHSPRVFELGGTNLTSVDWHPSRRRLVVGGRAVLRVMNQLYFLDLDDPTNNRTLSFPAKEAKKHRVASAPDIVLRIRHSRDGRYLAVGTRSGNVFVWDLQEPDAAPLRLTKLPPTDPDVQKNDPHWSTEIRQLEWGHPGYTLYGRNHDYIFSWQPLEDRLHLLAMPNNASHTGHLNNFALHPAGFLYVNLRPNANNPSGGTLGVYRCPDLKLAQPANPEYWDFCPQQISRTGELMVCEVHNKVTLYHTAFQQLLRQLRLPLSEFSELPGHSIRQILLDGDAKRLFTVQPDGQNRTIRIWDTLNGQLCQSLLALPDSPSIALADEVKVGPYLAVVGRGRVYVYRIDETIRTTHRVKGHFVHRLATNPSGTHLAITEVNPVEQNRLQTSLFTWSDLLAGCPAERLMEYHAQIRPDQSDLAVLWDASGVFVDTFRRGVNESDQTYAHYLDHRFQQHFELGDKLHLRYAHVAHDGRLWLAHKATLSIFDPKTFTRSAHWHYRWGELRGSSEITGIASNQHYAITTSRDGSVRCFPVHAQGYTPPLCDVQHESCALTAVAMLPGEDRALVGTEPGHLHLVSVPDGKAIEQIKAHCGIVRTIAFSRHNLLATASTDKTIKLWCWHKEKLELLATLTAPLPVMQVVWSGDGRKLAVLHQGETGIRIWHVDRLVQEWYEAQLGHQALPSFDDQTANPSAAD